MSGDPFGEGGNTLGDEGLPGEGAEGMGEAGMPVEGQGPGQQDKERQWQAWMREDDDIWGVPADDIGPVID